MNAPYRDRGERHRRGSRVVRFSQPIAAGSLVKKLLAMFLGLLLTGLWGWAEMECDRAKGTCEVREWHSIVRRSHTVRLAEIRGVRVTEYRGTKGSRHGVVWLDKSSGPEELTLSSVSATPAEAASFAEELEAFLATPSQPTFRASITTQTTDAVVAGLTVLLVLLGLALSVAEVVKAKRGTVVLIDDDRRIVALAARGGEPAREVPFDDVMAVAIDKAEPRAGAGAVKPYAAPVFLVLVTKRGERIPATPPAMRNHGLFDTDAARARLAEALGVSGSRRKTRA